MENIFLNPVESPSELLPNPILNLSNKPIQISSLVCFISETGPLISILKSASIFIFKLPSSNLILISFLVNFFMNAATAVAQAAVPHAFVSPAPRSHTFT